MKAPLRLRVMTFNIHGARPAFGLANLEAVAGVIRDAEPDLVALQEVHHYLPPPYVFQDQPEKLRKILGREVAFCPSFSLGPMKYGNVILSRVAPDRVRRIRLPSFLEARTMMEASFTITGRAFRFFNTHLTFRHAERQRQLRIVRNRVVACDEPLIAAGDWNATTDSPDLDLLEETGLRHTVGPEVLTFPADSPLCQLDYVMVSRHFEVERAAAIHVRVSDHLPVVADVVLR